MRPQVLNCLTAAAAAIDITASGKRQCPTALVIAHRRVSFWFGCQVSGSPLNPPIAVGQSNAGYGIARLSSSRCCRRGDGFAGSTCISLIPSTLHAVLTTMNKTRLYILSSLLATVLATGACGMAPTKPMGTTSTTQSSGTSAVSPAMGSDSAMHNAANTDGLSRGQSNFQQ